MQTTCIHIHHLLEHVLFVIIADDRNEARTAQTCTPHGRGGGIELSRHSVRGATCAWGGEPESPSSLNSGYFAGEHIAEDVT